MILDVEVGMDDKYFDLTDDSIVLVECIYNKNKCPEDDIFNCGNLNIISYTDIEGCSKMLVPWTTYLIYKKYFIKVKND